MAAVLKYFGNVVAFDARLPLRCVAIGSLVSYQLSKKDATLRDHMFWLPMSSFLPSGMIGVLVGGPLLKRVIASIDQREC